MDHFFAIPDVYRNRGVFNGVALPESINMTKTDYVSYLGKKKKKKKLRKQEDGDKGRKRDSVLERS